MKNFINCRKIATTLSGLFTFMFVLNFIPNTIWFVHQPKAPRTILK